MLCRLQQYRLFKSRLHRQALSPFRGQVGASLCERLISADAYFKLTILTIRGDAVTVVRVVVVEFSRSVHITDVVSVARGRSAHG